MSLPDDKLEIGLKVCKGLTIGQSVLRSCEENGTKEPTFFYWLTKSPKLVEEYIRARLFRADARYESIDGVIADLRNGDIDSNMARVIIDTIKWQCGKEKGAVYGDSTQLRHADADGKKLVIETAIRGLPNSGNKEDNSSI